MTLAHQLIKSLESANTSGYAGPVLPSCISDTQGGPASSSTDQGLLQVQKTPHPPPHTYLLPQFKPPNYLFPPPPDSPTASGPHVRTTLLCALTQQTTSRHNHDNVIIFSITGHYFNGRRRLETTLHCWNISGQAKPLTGCHRLTMSQANCRVQSRNGKPTRLAN